MKGYDWCNLLEQYSTCCGSLYCETMCYTLAVELLTESYMRQVVANVMVKAPYITGNGIVQFYVGQDHPNFSDRRVRNQQIKKVSSHGFSASCRVGFKTNHKNVEIYGINLDVNHTKCSKYWKQKHYWNSFCYVSFYLVVCKLCFSFRLTVLNVEQCTISFHQFYVIISVENYLYFC